MLKTEITNTSEGVVVVVDGRLDTASAEIGRAHV